MAAGTWTVVRPRLTTTTQGGCASGRYRFRPQIAIGAGTAVAIETATVVLMPSDPLDILGDPALARDRA
jgi:hypothetical protein